MKNEIISVIIPVNNVEKYIESCLKSVVQQTYPHLEIIVINDGSTDGSEAIIRRYASIDSRIKLINQQHAGPSAARNNGMSLATGTYIAFIDSDDYIEECMLERMLLRMKSTGADIVECGYNEAFIHEQPIRKIAYFKTYDEIIGTENILEKHVKGNISLLVWNKFNY